jgi:SWI/SNF related-matrix-associated actin-dependent regulator of chromatin subfamily C
MYQENPLAYLDATTCRRNIIGDACTIIRMHTFLEHWGLINFKYYQA